MKDRQDLDGCKNIQGNPHRVQKAHKVRTFVYEMRSDIDLHVGLCLASAHSKRVSESVSRGMSVEF